MDPADTPTETNTVGEETAPNEVPSKESQRSVIKDIIEKANDEGFLQPGNDYYLVSARWFNSWKSYVDFPHMGRGTHTHHSSSSSMIEAAAPSEMDNSHLLDDDGELKKTVHETYDFNILNKATWDLLHAWYGGGPEIARKCVPPARHHSMPSVELRKYKLQVVWSRQPKKVVEKRFSKSTTIKNFVLEMRKEMKFNIKNIRVYDFHNGRKLSVLNKWENALDESNIMDGQHVLIEEHKKDGSWPSDKIYPQYGNQTSHHYTPSPPGQTGLQNLGNTCFMNSSLQCLASTAPLTDFFLSKSYKQDINTVNPLGTKGEMSNAYYDLLKEIWSSTVGVSTPREMKNTIQRFAPQFSGYNQHDSQELLAFLLDGLHEDLNRIKVKPYVEYKSNWSSDEAWDIGHKLRNDSVIVDLFQGQLKSRLRCPLNDKEYFQYDPFMYLTVPLPVQSKRKIVVTLYKADELAVPIKYRVIVEKAGTVRDLKVELGKLCGIDPNCLITVDVHMCKFHKEFVDKESLDEIMDNDHVAAHEILLKPRKVKEAKKEGETEGDEEVKKETAGEGDESSQEEGNDLVRVILYQKINAQYVHREFFGTPLILSVPSKCSYQELYTIIVKRMKVGSTKSSGGMYSTIPPLPINLDEDHVEEARKDGKINADNEHLCQLLQRDESELKGYPRFSDDSVFELIATNVQGDARNQPSLFNDGLPMNLKDRQTICCFWPQKHMNHYCNSYAELDVVNDQDSWTTKSEAKKKLTLDDCLRAYAEEEQLSETDTWYCSDCQQHVRAFKKFSVSRGPKILVVHLKRFSYRGQTSRERIDDVVHFPLHDLDISEFVEGGNDSNLYDLYAISNHYGSLGGGHYTAFVRGRNDTSQWYRCDDSNVSRCDSSSIITEAAYVLFYVRKDVEWPAFVETVVEKKESEKTNEDGGCDDNDEYEEDDELEESSEPKQESKEDNEEKDLVEGVRVINLNRNNNEDEDKDEDEKMNVDNSS